MNPPPDASTGRARHAQRAALPVFTDASGQRRRIIKIIGAVASIFLIGALALAGVGLFGGPNTPFSIFGAPLTGTHGKAGPGHSRGANGAGSGGQQPGPAGSPGSGSSASRRSSPRPTSSGSSRASSATPSPTNPAGKTPPGQGRSKTPHPKPSPSSHGH